MGVGKLSVGALADTSTVVRRPWCHHSQGSQRALQSFLKVGGVNPNITSILHILEVSVPLANWWQLAACDWLIWWLSPLMWCPLPYLMWLYVSLHWHVCTCAWMCFLRKWMYSRILSFSHIRQLILEEHSTSYQVQSWNHHQGKQTSQHNAKPQLQKGKEMRKKLCQLKEHFYKTVLLRHLFSKVEDHHKM